MESARSKDVAREALDWRWLWVVGGEAGGKVTAGAGGAVVEDGCWVLPAVGASGGGGGEGGGGGGRGREG